MTKDKHSLPPLSTWLPLEGILVLVMAGVTAAIASLPIVFVPGILAYAILAYLRYRRFREAPDGLAAEPLRPDLSTLRPEHAARVNRWLTESGTSVPACGTFTTRGLVPCISRHRALRLRPHANTRGAPRAPRRGLRCRRCDRRALRVPQPGNARDPPVCVAQRRRDRTGRAHAPR